MSLTTEYRVRQRCPAGDEAPRKAERNQSSSFERVGSRIAQIARITELLIRDIRDLCSWFNFRPLGVFRGLHLFVGLLMGASVATAELPVWFDAFQSTRESLQGWQSFRAASKLGFEEDETFTAGRALKVKVSFSAKYREATLIWRFPDVQMKRFRMRVKVPPEARDVYLWMVTNDTEGNAAFFRPYAVGKPSHELPIHTRDGVKEQPASPLPAGKWATYEVVMPDDLFYEQKKKRSKGQSVQDFALMNTGRDQLKLSAESRPATEAFFITFVVPPDSPLIGRELELLVDFAEIY